MHTICLECERVYANVVREFGNYQNEWANGFSVDIVENQLLETYDSIQMPIILHLITKFSHFGCF